MTPTKTEILYLLCPNLYRHPIPKGFECGDGWFSILVELSQKLEAEILRLPEDQRKYYYVSYVSEVFGTVSFYMSAENPYMRCLINDACLASYLVCDVCGKKISDCIDCGE